MVSKEFLGRLSRRKQVAMGTTVPAAMQALAHSYGYTSFEELMAADAEDKLDAETRRSLFTDLSPYINRAFSVAEKNAATAKDIAEMVERAFALIRRFFLGYTQEEAADAELMGMLTQVDRAEKARDAVLLGGGRRGGGP